MKVNKIFSMLMIVVLSLLIVTSTGCANNNNQNSNSKTASTIIKNPYGLENASEELVEALTNSGEITTYTYSQELTDDTKKFLEYYKKYYGGTVKYKYIAYADNQTQYLIDYAAGEMPDLVMIDYRKWPKVGNRQIAYNMDELKKLGVLGLDHPELKKYENLADNYTLKGKTYAYSVSYGSPVMMGINLELFDKYSVKSPVEYYKEGNWNTDTFAECIKNISRTTADGTKIYGVSAWNLGWFVTADDNSLVSWDKDWKLKSNLKNSGVMATLQNIKDWHTNGYFGGDTKAFANGTLAIFTATADNLDDALKPVTFKWDIVPFPYGVNNTSGMLPGEITGSGVATSTKNPQGVVNYGIASSVFNSQYYGIELGSVYCESYKIYNEKQMNLINTHVDKISEDLMYGVGSLNKTPVWHFWNDIMSPSVTVKQAIDTHSPVFEGQCAAEMSEAKK